MINNHIGHKGLRNGRGELINIRCQDKLQRVAEVVDRQGTPRKNVTCIYASIVTKQDIWKMSVEP